MYKAATAARTSDWRRMALNRRTWRSFSPESLRSCWLPLLCCASDPSTECFIHSHTTLCRGFWALFSAGRTRYGLNTRTQSPALSLWRLFCSRGICLGACAVPRVCAWCECVCPGDVCAEGPLAVNAAFFGAVMTGNCRKCARSPAVLRLCGSPTAMAAGADAAAIMALQKYLAYHGADKTPLDATNV